MKKSDSVSDGHLSDSADLGAIGDQRLVKVKKGTAEKPAAVVPHPVRADTEQLAIPWSCE